MDMFEATAEFEAMCVRLATYRMTPLERSHLMDLHAQSEAMVEAGDVDAYDTLKPRLPRGPLRRPPITASCWNRRSPCAPRLSGFRRTQLRHGERIRTSRAEHGEILAAIAEGDGDAAARRMRAHMLNAASAIGHYIAEHAGA